MKWQSARRGGNIEDRRGRKSGSTVVLGGVGGIIVIVLGLLFGGDPAALMQQIGNMQSGAEQTAEVVSSPEEDKLMDFADVVLAGTQDVWSALFQQAGLRYRAPSLVVYRDVVETGGCGTGQSAFGPFYCPGDQKIYLDLSFNQELSQRYGAKGEFALAYVIAHEVGHHVQHLIGNLDHRAKARNEREKNKLSVMTELQADFYAGVWAHYLNQMTDIEISYQDFIDGMRAAAAVGDDRLQEEAYGHSNPESFTHGSSEQRMYWLEKGYKTGDIRQGDTFNDPSLQ